MVDRRQGSGAGIVQTILTPFRRAVSFLVSGNVEQLRRKQPEISAAHSGRAQRLLADARVSAASQGFLIPDNTEIVVDPSKKKWVACYVSGDHPVFVIGREILRDQHYDDASLVVVLKHEHAHVLNDDSAKRLALRTAAAATTIGLGLASGIVPGVVAFVAGSVAGRVLRRHNEMRSDREAIGSEDDASALRRFLVRNQLRPELGIRDELIGAFGKRAGTILANGVMAGIHIFGTHPAPARRIAQTERLGATPDETPGSVTVVIVRPGPAVVSETGAEVERTALGTRPADLPSPGSHQHPRSSDLGNIERS